MASRLSAPDALDYFPTPPWATRALLNMIIDHYGKIDRYKALDPCCGELHMVKPMREYFDETLYSDIYQYGEHPIRDFLDRGAYEHAKVDLTIANPPFVLAQQFIQKAIDISTIGCAMLVRGSYLEGQNRYETLFRHNPPSHIFQFTERVVMLKGRLIQAGKPDPFSLPDPGKVASSATSYVWLAWLYPKGSYGDPRFIWIPKCRRELEREGDYPQYTQSDVINYHTHNGTIDKYNQSLAQMGELSSGELL